MNVLHLQVESKWYPFFGLPIRLKAKSLPSNWLRFVTKLSLPQGNPLLTFRRKISSKQG